MSAAADRKTMTARAGIDSAVRADILLPRWRATHTQRCLTHALPARPCYRQTVSRSGGNPGEKQVRAVTCHRGIYCTNSSAALGAGLTAVHDIASGNAGMTRDSEDRLSPAGTHRQRPAPYASKRELSSPPGLSWQCPCGSYNPMGRYCCAGCGKQFAKQSQRAPHPLVTRFRPDARGPAFLSRS